MCNIHHNLGLLVIWCHYISHVCIASRHRSSLAEVTVHRGLVLAAVNVWDLKTKRLSSLTVETSD